MLQFEVIEHRLRNEYGVRVRFDRLPYRFARWLEGPDLDQDKLELPGRQSCVTDVEGRPLVLFETEWLMRRAEEENRSVRPIGVSKGVFERWRTLAACGSAAMTASAQRA